LEEHGSAAARGGRRRAPAPGTATRDRAARARRLGALRTALRPLALLGLALALAPAGPVAAEDAPARPGETAAVDAFRAEMDKWVETRRIASEEKTDWEVEQQTLRATRELLTQEKEALEAEIAELEQSNTASDEERRDLLLQRADYQSAGNALEEKIRAMEEEVLALAPQLPEPLQKKLEPLLVQIPRDPASTKLQLGQRLMNVLGVLAQTEKFNGTATFVGETRAVKGDQKVQVRTLYWGLGQAIYVDSKGDIAGLGHPGAKGWEFSEEPALADDAKRLLDIYEGNVDLIQFVKMPVEIR
jgi:Protein of unknown function (DUF3450)